MNVMTDLQTYAPAGVSVVVRCDQGTNVHPEDEM
jgi:hypothetical protein